MRAYNVERAAIERDAFRVEFERLAVMLRVRQFDEIACDEFFIFQYDDLGALRFVIGHQAEPRESGTAVAGDAAGVLGLFKAAILGFSEKLFIDLPDVLCIGRERRGGQEADRNRHTDQCKCLN